MPFVAEIVTLTVDGTELRGWQEVKVDRSMQNAAISFSLEATNPAWSADAKKLRYGKLVEIRTSASSGPTPPGGGVLLCKGYIDDYSADYGENSAKTIKVSGRSKAGDAIDCPPSKHKTGRIEKKKLDQVAKELDEFDVGWSTDQQLDEIPKVQIEPGESMYATVEREARRQGLMLAGQTDGSVKITRAGTKRHAGALRLGDSPVQSIGVEISAKQKRSPVVVRGQRAKGTGKDNLRQEVQELDETVERHRPIIIILEGDAPKKDLQKRAKWERLRRSGFGTAASAKVSTWRDEGGEIWDPGRLVAIVVEPEDIDQDLTLSTVSFTQSEKGGTLASLKFVDPRTHGGKKAKGGKGSDKAYDPGSGIDE